MNTEIIYAVQTPCCSYGNFQRGINGRRLRHMVDCIILYGIEHLNDCGCRLSQNYVTIYDERKKNQQGEFLANILSKTPEGFAVVETEMNLEPQVAK